MSVQNPAAQASGGAGPAETRNADADADFAAALIGELANARLAALTVVGNAYTRLLAAAGETALSESAEVNLLVRSSLAARDQSAGAGTRMVPLEARGAVSTQVYTLKRLLTDAALRVDRVDAGEWAAQGGDLVSAVVNGRAPSSVIAAYALGIDTKRDSDGTLLTPTEMNRTVRTSTVNPADAAVLATLDCRGLTNKSLIIDSTVADDAHIEVSPEGTNWHRIASAVAYGVGVTIMLTAVQFEAVRGFRYVRMIQNGAAVGTVIGVISAQGA